MTETYRKGKTKEELLEELYEGRKECKDIFYSTIFSKIKRNLKGRNNPKKRSIAYSFICDKLRQRNIFVHS